METILPALIPVAGQVIGGLMGGSAQQEGISQANEVQQQAYNQAMQYMNEYENTWLPWLEENYGQLQNEAENTTQQAQNWINTYATNAMNRLGTGRTHALNAYGDAYDHASQAIGQGFGGGIDEYRQAMAKNEAQYAPYLGLGEWGVDEMQTLMNDPGSYERSPGYEFLRDEALRGIQAQAAAGGNLQSGNTLRELTQYSSGLAAQDYANQYQRLANIVQGVGLPATSNVSQLRFNTAGGISNLMAQEAAQQAGLDQWYGGGVANINTNYSQNTANQQNALANALSGNLWQGTQMNTGFGQNYINSALGVGTNVAENLTNLAIGQGSAAANNSMYSGNVAGNQWNNMFSGLGTALGGLFGGGSGGGGSGGGI